MVLSAHRGLDITNWDVGDIAHVVFGGSGYIFGECKLGKQKYILNCFTSSDPHRDIILKHIETYLSQILTFFVLKSGEDQKETIILMKSRALRSLDFIRIILSSSSLLLVRDPAVTTVVYLAKLIQTDSRYDWFKRISDTRASRHA